MLESLTFRDKLCPFCGMPACGGDAAASRRCDACDAGNPVSNRFCGQCGARLAERASAESAAGSPPEGEASPRRAPCLAEWPRARHVLQAAAVFGCGFTIRDMADLVEAEPATVEIDLGHLQALGYIKGEEVGAARLYRFASASLRTAAYESLPLGPRQALHRRCAAVLGERPGLVEERPQVVALHHARGEAAARAWPLYKEAGDKAIGRGALHEAERHFDAALDQAHLLHEPGALQQARFTVELARSRLLMMLKGHAAPEVEASLARTTHLAQAMADDRDLFALLWVRSAYYLVRGPFGRAAETARQMVRLADLIGVPLFKGEAYRRLALAEFVAGDMADAERHYGQAFAMFDDLDPDAKIYNTQPTILARAGRAWLLWAVGRPSLALDEVRRAEQHARVLGDPYAHAITLGIEASLGHLRQEPTDAALAGERCARISRAHSFPYWEGWGDIFAGWAEAALGEARGIDRLRRGWLQYLSTGAFQLDLYARALLADALRRHGDFEDAIALLDFDRVDCGTAAPFTVPEAYLCRARVQAARGQGAAAATDIAMARAAARRQGAIMMGRRAELHLHHRHCSPSIGEPGPAFDLLLRDLSRP